MTYVTSGYIFIIIVIEMSQDLMNRSVVRKNKWRFVGLSFMWRQK